MRHAACSNQLQVEAPRLPPLALTPNLFSIFLLCLQFALHYINHSKGQRVKGLPPKMSRLESRVVVSNS